MMKTNYLMKFLAIIMCLLWLTGIKAQTTVSSPPVFTSCPGNITTALCTPIVDYDAIATGTEPIDYTYEFSGVTIASGTGTGTGSSFNAGTTAVMVVASNTEGSDTCTFDVFVTNLPPTFTFCPSDISLYPEPGMCGATFNYTLPVASVPCPLPAAPATIPYFNYIGEFHGHKYFCSTYDYNSWKTWPGARDLAASYGGYLITINNAEENEFVRQYLLANLNNNIWIGASDIASEGNWVWTDGSQLTYTNWNSGEPNNSNYAEHCAEYYYGNGLWNDMPEFYQYPFIIEFNTSEVSLVSGFSPDAFFPIGQTVTSYQVTDAYGQNATCSFTVNVIDTIPPTIVCPGDQTIHCQNEEVELPIGFDNCVLNGDYYKVETAAYEPFDFTGEYYNTCYDNSFEIYLPFTFKYFGVEQSYLQMFCNGFVVLGPFWPGVGNGCCNGQPLPNANFHNAIAATWSDLEGEMAWKTFGTAPNRKFVVNWKGNEAYYSNYCDVQLVLHEGSNKIEIISIRNDSFTERTKTMGLNYNGSKALVVDGRNGTNWSATNECLLFSPSAVPTQIAGPELGSLPEGTSTLTYAVIDNSGNTATCSFNITYIPYLSGYVTVGEGGDFPNLTGEGGLFDSLNNSNICEYLEVYIVSDIEEPGTYALNELSNHNAYIYIMPNDYQFYYIYGNVAQPMIRLNGADNVHFYGDYYSWDEKCLLFENLNPSQPVLELTNGATNNYVRGCVFAGINNNASSGVVVLGGSAEDDGNSFNNFSYNTFRNSESSSVLPANLFYSSGSPDAPNYYNYIDENNFTNFDQKGIWITSTGNGSDWYIYNNRFYFTISPITKANKIFVNFVPGSASDENYIEDNWIGGTDSYWEGDPWVCSGTGTMKGFVIDADYTYLDYNGICYINLTSTGIANFTGYEILNGDVDCYENSFSYEDWPIIVSGTGTIAGFISSSKDWVYIYDNYIEDIRFTKSTGSPVFKGIQIKKGEVYNNWVRYITTTQSNLTPTIYGICNIGSGLTEPNRIFNNMISINSGVSLKPKVYGLFDQSIGIGADFFLNSVYIFGNTTNGYFTSAFYRIGNASIVLYNNILVNSRVANVYAKHYTIHTNSKQNWMSDHNVLYTASGCLGNWGGAPYATMTAWRLMTGQDVNSIYFWPNFYDEYDLHLVEFGNDTLENAGGDLYTFDYDINWDYRSWYYPTPGCDELYFNGGGGYRNEPEAATFSESNSMMVYPNPVTSFSTISINLTKGNYITIELYNMLGEKILDIASGNYTAGTYNFNIDAGNIPAGAYMCRYMVNGGKSIMKRVEIVK